MVNREFVKENVTLTDIVTNYLTPCIRRKTARTIYYQDNANSLTNGYFVPHSFHGVTNKFLLHCPMKWPTKTSYVSHASHVAMAAI